MKEIKDIVQGYYKALKEGKQTALATIVKVEGSSYRRPGARMLVDEDGLLTGAISGGCLEGDVLRKALQAMHERKNKLVIYDATDEDDAKVGMQLGCNGIVYILFEPLQLNEKGNPVQLLEELISKREEGVLVTVFCTERNSTQPGTFLFLQESTSVYGPSKHSYLNDQIEQDAASSLRFKNSSIQTYSDNMSAFIQFIPPVISLFIAGAGNDAIPLVNIAQGLGWNVTIADGRPSLATVKRFPGANIIPARPSEALANIQVDPQTVFVLLTHNYNYDFALLEQLVIQDCVYIGILGPRKKLDRMLDDLKDHGVVLTEKQRSAIHGPVGLDIGAETAEEIAVSIVAEIIAVLTGRSATSLKDKSHSIHCRLGTISVSNE